jgi:hypothetical protein
MGQKILKFFALNPKVLQNPADNSSDVAKKHRSDIAFLPQAADFSVCLNTSQTRMFSAV